MSAEKRESGMEHAGPLPSSESSSLPSVSNMRLHRTLDIAYGQPLTQINKKFVPSALKIALPVADMRTIL